MTTKPIVMLPERPGKAITHLRAADPALARAIDAVGPFRLPRNPATLDELCRAVIGQQLSVIVASRIEERFNALVGDLGKAPPRHLLRFSIEQLRGVGLSEAKARTVHALAEFWAQEKLTEKRVAAMSDDDLIRHLTQVKGIGPWTVKMFLIFSLRRPDVMPHEDLGLRAGYKKIHGLDEMPHQREIPALTAHWGPWRTVATWYCWQFLKVP